MITGFVSSRGLLTVILPSVVMLLLTAVTSALRISKLAKGVVLPTSPSKFILPVPASKVSV